MVWHNTIQGQFVQLRPVRESDAEFLLKLRLDPQYNRFINPKLNLLFSFRRKEYNLAKPKVKPAVLDDIQDNERLFDKYFLLVLILYCTFALIYSVYLTMIRYYM